MEWILIFWIYMDRAGGPSTAEFRTKVACEEAGRAVLDARSFPGQSKNGEFICVSKGR